jgi:hypothetical protein
MRLVFIATMFGYRGAALDNCGARHPNRLLKTPKSHLTGMYSE